MTVAAVPDNCLNFSQFAERWVRKFGCFIPGFHGRRPLSTPRPLLARRMHELAWLKCRLDYHEWSSVYEKVILCPRR